MLNTTPLIYALLAVALALVLLAGSVLLATGVSLYMWWKEE